MPPEQGRPPSEHSHAGAHFHRTSTANFRAAFLLNFCFAIFEFFGGIWTNSTAIMADAVHDLGDSIAIGSSWWFEKRSFKRGDARFSYGYRRFSLLGSVVSAVTLLAGSAFILVEAIPRLFDPEPPYAPGMVFFAIVGLGVNTAAILRIRGSAGMNARVVAWHLFEDVLGWAAVLIVATVLLFVDVPILDPLLSLAITVFIAVRVAAGLRGILRIFLQAVPESVDIARLEETLRDVAGVADVHHTHVWSLEGERHVLSTHVVAAEPFDLDSFADLKNRIRNALHAFDLAHSTVEIELPGEICRIRPDAACVELPNRTTEPPP